MNLKQLEKEILKLRIQLEKETNKDIRKVLKRQKQHLEDMRKTLGSIYMKYADSEGSLIVNGIDRFHIMQDMEKNIVNTSRDLIKITTAITGVSLLKSYVNSYYKTANIIQDGISIGINYKILRPEFIESVLNANFEGQTYSNRIWKNTNKLANKLYTTIEKGISEGTSIQKLSREVKNAFGVNSYESKRLITTEMARVTSDATLNIYEDSGVVDKVMWVATLEANVTCSDCASLDGQIFDLNDVNKPTIPLHPNCRCAWISVIDGWQPKTRRDQDTKSNIPYKAYEDWKKNN